MKDQLEMSRDFLVLFQEVRVQRACQIQTIERELRNFKDRRHQLEFKEEQIILIIILDISKHSQIHTLCLDRVDSFSLQVYDFISKNQRELIYIFIVNI